MGNALTDQQVAILGYVRDHSAQTGDWPTFQDVADHLGLESQEVVGDEIQPLIDSGYMYQVCCGEEAGIYVRLPGEEDGPGRRVTVWTPNAHAH